jgi:competence protein ComFC
LAENPYVSALLDLFYPQRCVGCRRRASDLLCRECYENLPEIDRPYCARCGMPTAFEVYGCAECMDRDYAFYAARAPLRYDGVGKEIVHAIKYRGRVEAVDRLAAPLMAGVLEGERFDEVVPVPLHRLRLLRRGFNQAELLARAVAAQINAGVSDKLRAVRKTTDQVELTAGERRANVRGAYAAREEVRGRVLLVDDVFTTGATLDTCSEALVEAGADEVFALSLCRTC